MKGRGRGKESQKKNQREDTFQHSSKRNQGFVVFAKLYTDSIKEYSSTQRTTLGKQEDMIMKVNDITFLTLRSIVMLSGSLASTHIITIHNK